MSYACYAGGRRARRTRPRPPARARRRRVTRRPSSAVSDVTPASEMPHGTIAENAARSQSQLSANPCSVVARATRMPMAAILRAGRSAVGRHPHPGAALDPAGLQAQARAHLDQRFLKAPNEIHHIERLGQADDRIADQLAGAVPGDLAAAVGVDDGRAVDRALVRHRCACPRCTPTGARAAAGCPDRRRPVRRRARAAAARPPGSRRCPAAARRSAWPPTGSMRAMASTVPASCVVRRGGEGQRLADGVVVELETRPAPARRGSRAARRAGPRRRTRRAAVRSANPGTISGVGRFTARPSAAVNSALVTGAGPVRFTGPDTSSWVIANSSARTSSSRLIHGMYWRPLPSRAPSPSENSGLIRPSIPPAGASTRPVRTSTTRAPACSAGAVAASQSSQSWARKPPTGRRGFVDGAAAGVAVVADRAGVDQHGNAGLDDRGGQHLGRPDAAVAQALLERARPPLVADVDAAQVHHRVHRVQRARVELAGVRVPEHLVGVRRSAAHDPQHPVVGGAQARTPAPSRSARRTPRSR